MPGAVWDGISDRARKDTAIVVNGTRIESIVALRGLPVGIRAVRFPSCTALPGLIDGHVHYSGLHGPLYLAAGVTTVRDVGNDLGWVLRWRRRNETHPAAGPTILCCGPLLDGPTPYWPLMCRPHTGARGIERSVHELADAGVDAIKLYVGVDGRFMDAAVRAAHRRGLKVTAHLGAVDWRRAIEAGIDGIEHFSGCGPVWRDATGAEVAGFVSAVSGAGIAMMPTIVVWDRIGRKTDSAVRGDRRLRFLHPRWRASWKAHAYSTRLHAPETLPALLRAVARIQKCVPRMMRLEVPVGIGTDAPFPGVLPGFGVHDEMELFAQSGIPPREILRAATAVNAQIIGARERKGRLVPGLDADIVIVRGDPLSRIGDMKKVAAVVHRGTLARPRELLASAEAMFERRPDGVHLRQLEQWVASSER